MVLRGPNQIQKLGSLAKFCCFIGLMFSLGCEGVQETESSARRPANVASDIDFSQLKPEDIHVNLKPTCALNPHTDETKRNLVCDLKTTTNSKDVFKRIDGAEMLIEFKDGKKII